MTDATAAWRAQTEQLMAGLKLIRTQAPPELRFSEHTFQHAENLLEQLVQTPPGQRPEEVPDELPPEADLELEEMVQSLQPAVLGMPPATARRVLMAFVGTVVFLLVIQFSIVYPEAAELLTGNGGIDALTAAGGAAWLTGKIWDRLNPSAGEEPS
ncbi:hypothetical protein [Streptomyces sp. NPDC042319]|uniref:hypothetical protein n=1 Tax=Streptomyces sp. NPDC042319 TaxID=3154332 RepID=UPI0033EF96AB